MSDPPDERKRRRVRRLQRYVLNPPTKLLVWAGLVPGYVLVETHGRRTGKRRTTVVGMKVEGVIGWIVAEQGRHAGYVRNLQADPAVRIRLDRRWHPARARVVADDDPQARLDAFARRSHAAAVRRFGTDLTTVRVELVSGQPARESETMRGVVYTEYGSPDVLRLADLERPTPKDDEVLIKVDATTVNRTDCGFRRAEPFIVRFFSGLLRPKKHVLGTELAGEVVAVGAAVTQFAVGDDVFGVNADNFGAHAEFVCMSEQAPLAHKPTNMTFEEAAAVCDGAILALTYLRAADLRRGQKILVYGASGSIGTAAVQLAKHHFEADVTAVCNTTSVEALRSLGADRVIDYTREDFTGDGETYDVIFDAVGKTSFRRCKRALKHGGVHMETDLGFLWQNPLLALLTARIGTKKVLFPLPRYTKKDVLFLKELIEAGKYRAVIDRSYSLERVVDATEYVETEQKVGNVVLTVSHDRTDAPTTPT